ncbi:MAG TPA: alpha/beta fold hydrolase [Edaphobacter sp.]|jgi:pimeloyl-ACP methyl ester carboxylesterase|nr:alpha/beta fold hydrolase [Edaphobacter sp.]
MREVVLAVVLTLVSRLLLHRDQVNGTKKRMLRIFPFVDQKIVILSGARRLSGVYVSAGDDTPAVLICHGIGELVEYWGSVQALLQSMGISSLVFNYSGYGDSSGYISAAHCEEDAIAAYGVLAARGHQSIALLGFSLGSAVGCAVASRIEIDGLILCEGFSTLREAGLVMGFPRWMTSMVPKSWETIQLVRELKVPVLAVHSDEDDLFPLSMARSVVEASGERGELIVVKGLSHNAPIFTPTRPYWQPIAEWIKRRSSQVDTKVSASGEINLH